jgi:hypothetical protein
MGKKKAKVIPFPQQVVEAAPVAPVLEASPVLPVEELQTSAVSEVYAFQSRARCPKCQGIRTVRRGAHGDTQYRICLTPSCGKKFAVKGWKV